MAFPSFAILFGVTIYVFFNTLKESLGYIPELFLHNFTTDYYISLVHDEIFLKSLIFSFSVAFASTILSTLLGIFLGYFISKKSRSFGKSIYKLPIILSYVASAVLVYNAYSDRGLIYHILNGVGISVKNLNIIYNDKGIAVIILYMFKAIPFIALSLYPIFFKIDLKYREVAENLGCSKLMYIFKILIPISRRTILACALIIFNYNLFSYEGFYYLGPSVPPAIGVLAYQNYVSADMSRRAAGMAINMIMIIISLILCFIYYKFIKGQGEEYESIF